MRNSSRLFVAVAAAGLVAAGGSAFTATNTVAASSAGSGSTTISTYSTSDVQYNANATDPQNLDSVEFTLDKSARYVAMRTKTSGTWVRSDDARVDADGAGAGTVMVDSCTSADDITWTCDVTGLSETVAAADNLTVVATS